MPPTASRAPGLGAALRHMRPLMVPLVGIVVVRGFMMASLTIFLPTFLTDEGAGLWLAGAALTLLEAAGVAAAAVVVVAVAAAVEAAACTGAVAVVLLVPAVVGMAAAAVAAVVVASMPCHLDSPE